MRATAVSAVSYVSPTRRRGLSYITGLAKVPTFMVAIDLLPADRVGTWAYGALSVLVANSTFFYGNEIASS